MWRDDLSFRKHLKRVVTTRIAGATLATAGVALIGVGTAASPVTPFAKVKPVAVADPGCDSTTHVCLNESFEGLTALQVQASGVPVECTLGLGIPGVDGWVFVLPNSQGLNPAPVFNLGTFTAIFSSGSLPGVVGAGGNNSNKFATVLAPAGSTLLEAQSNANSGGTDVTNQTFNVTGICPAAPASSSSSSSSTSSSRSTTTSTSTEPSSTTTRTTSTTSTNSAPGSTTTSTRSGTTATAGVLGTSTSTPSTGGDIAFGAGLGLLVGGAALFFAARQRRRTRP